MKITQNFSLEEFHCKDGTHYPEIWIKSRLKPLCESLEVIRAIVQEPLIITSGYRSEKWNKKQGGVKGSQHVQGKAVDFYCEDKKPQALAKIILKLITDNKIILGGVGLYDGFVHYDIRESRAYWEGKRKIGVV